MRRLVAIHQPNFFPWLGYFDKISRADVLIFLDAVDYPRSGSGGMGSWSNRVRIAIKGEPRWITCPLKRMPLGSPILAAEIDDSQPWRRKLLSTLVANYGRATNFKPALEVLTPLIDDRVANLASYNISVVKALSRHLGLSVVFRRQSELPHQGKATDLLISLVQAVGGTGYLVGGGASGYQLDEKFAEAGLELVYQQFEPKPYGPPDSFLPGLSAIDYLMRDGRPLTQCGVTPAA